MVQTYDERTGKIVAARARDIRRTEKYADELRVIELEDGPLSALYGHPPYHMDAAGRFVEAGHIREASVSAAATWLYGCPF